MQEKNNIEPDLKQSLPSLEDISKKIEDGLEDIEKLIPDDPISSSTGAKVGTEEHIEQGELLNKVKETNSTKRVNRILRTLKLVGYIGLLIASIVKFTGIVYDIDFHVPFLKNVIGDIGVATLGFFITVIILIMTHLTSDGLVNNKWKALPRIILVWLAVAGLTASFYFDYRAISNYTNVVVAKIKQSKVKDVNDMDGIAMQNINDNVVLLKTSLKAYQDQLSVSMKRLNILSNARGKINDSIERVKAKKEETNSQRTIRKLNQNIYTSRKQIDSISAEEKIISARQKELMSQISLIQEKINATSKDKEKIIEGVDNKMSKKQLDRLVFLFALVVFIEVTSFGGLLADFLGNKNIENDLKEKLDQLNNNTNVMAVLRGHLTAQEVQQASAFDKELTVRSNISKVHQLSNISAMHRQAENIKGFTQASHAIGEATNEIVTEAVNGFANGIRANMYEQKAKKLLEVLQKGQNKISIENINQTRFERNIGGIIGRDIKCIDEKINGEDSRYTVKYRKDFDSKWITDITTTNLSEALASIDEVRVRMS